MSYPLQEDSASACGLMPRLISGDNVTQCCLPTCKQFSCNATEGWLPAPGTDISTRDRSMSMLTRFEHCKRRNSKDNVTGDKLESSDCCLPVRNQLMRAPCFSWRATDAQACSSYTCSPAKGLMQITDAATTPGDTDEAVTMQMSQTFF